jgi:hypothetical protein
MRGFWDIEALRCTGNHCKLHPAFSHAAAGSCSHGVMLPEQAVVTTKQPCWLVHASTVS